MKTIRRAIVGAVVLLFTSAVHSFAIEGIQVSVQSSNVLLSWPSATNETYIVQYLPALLSTNSWLTLTDGFPATLNTNLTVFVASNAVQPPVWITNDSGGSSTNGGGLIPPGATNGSGGTFASTTGFYRVVRDGVHIFGLTNGMVLSGSIQQPLEFAVDTTDEISGVTFYDTNGNPLIGAQATSGPGGGWILNWNTAKSPNGNIAIQAELDFDNTNPVISVPVTVTVSNLFSFPNYLTQEFGSQMWIYAQTIPNADVEIDIYDENTNYLGSFYPVSDSNGLISFIWDLTGGNGSTNFLGVFTVEDSPSVVSQSANIKSVNSGSPNFLAPSTRETLVHKVKAAGASPDNSSGGGAVQLWTQEPSWKPNNYWVVGVGDIDSQAADNQLAQDTVIGGLASTTEYGGVIGALGSVGAIMSPGNSVQAASVYIVNSFASRTTLLGYLASLNPRYENFFWFGHGTETSISAYESGTRITMDDLSFALGNVPLSYSITHAAFHPYRFTWIESCNTAKGNFCEAFAVPAQDLSTNNFVASGLTSRAYLGYKNEIGFDTSYDGNWGQQSTMMFIFLTNFVGGNGSLAAVVYNAQNNTGPFASNVSGITYRMDSSATSYGATDLLYPNPW
jgi:hypothetical protein